MKLFEEKREESNPETADDRQKGKRCSLRVCSPCTLHGFRNDYRLCCQ